MPTIKIDPRIPLTPGEVFAGLVKARFVHDEAAQTGLLLGLTSKNIDRKASSSLNRLVLLDQLFALRGDIYNSFNEKEDFHKSDAKRLYNSAIYTVVEIIYKIDSVHPSSSEQICGLLSDLVACVQAVGNIEKRSSFVQLLKARKTEPATDAKRKTGDIRRGSIRDKVNAVLEKRPGLSPEEIFAALQRLDAKRFNRRTRRQAIRDIAAIIANPLSR